MVEATSAANRQIQWQLTLGILVEIALTLCSSIFSLLEGLARLEELLWSQTKARNNLIVLFSFLSVGANAVQVNDVRCLRSGFGFRGPNI